MNALRTIKPVRSDPCKLCGKDFAKHQAVTCACPTPKGFSKTRKFKGS